MKKLLALMMLTAVGCGGTDLLGTDDMMSTTVYRLVSGMYTISNATAVSDGCMVVPTGFNGVVKAVTNDGAGNVMVTSFGMGTVGASAPNTGSLTLTGHYTMSGVSCVYDYTVTSAVTVTADNTFTLASTEAQTNRTACVSPSAATCTSTYNTTWTKNP